MLTVADVVLGGGAMHNLTRNSGACRRGSPVLLPVFVAALLVTGAGCRMALPERKIEAKVYPQQDITVTQNQARLRMRALVDPMCGAIEQAADAIIAGTTNRTVQQAALRWKIEGVPAVREALFQSDPFTAMADTWVLFYQMADYFETGRGQEALGPASAQATATCRRLEEEFTQIVASATKSGDVSKARAFARKWAADHSIHYAIADRESILSRVFERDVPDVLSTGEAVAEVTTTLEDLNRRLEIYSTQLFRQARWEAERFKFDLLSDLAADQAVPLAARAVQSAERAVVTVERLAPTIERAASVAAVVTVERLAPALERAVGVAQDAPKVVAVERETAFKALHDELARTIQFLHDERLAALDGLTKERSAALQELHETIAAERHALTSDVQQLSLKVADHAIGQLARLLGAAMAAAIIAACLGVFLVRWVFFRRPLDIRRE